MWSKKYKTGVKVFAPATIGNVGVGFDILGLAIHDIGDIVLIKPNKNNGIAFTIHGDKGVLPREIDKNTVTVPILAMLRELGIDADMDIQLYKNLPIGSGMGSSAASAVAGAFAANTILGNPFSKKELLPFALEGEKIATGVAHSDNVAPSLLGGLLLCRGNKTERIFTPDGLIVVVVHPNIKILTKDSRAVLPKEIPLQKAVTQWGNISGFILGMMKSDLGLIKDSLHDNIIEPSRAALIPGFYNVQQAAMKNGAMGCSISGAGPSIFALCENTIVAENVAKQMKAEFNKIKISSNVYISAINNQGAKIL